MSRGPEESPERPTRENPLVLEDNESWTVGVFWLEDETVAGGLLTIYVKDEASKESITLLPDAVAKLRDLLNREALRVR